MYIYLLTNIINNLYCITMSSSTETIEELNNSNQREVTQITEECKETKKLYDSIMIQYTVNFLKKRNEHTSELLTIAKKQNSMLLDHLNKLKSEFSK